MLVARVEADGRLSAWTVAPFRLLTGRGFAGIDVRGDVAVLAGGGLVTGAWDEAAVTMVKLAPSGPELVELPALPAALAAPAVALTDDAVWVAGGATGGVDQMRVFVATKTATAFSGFTPVGYLGRRTSGATAVTEAKRMLVFGGRLDALAGDRIVEPYDATGSLVDGGAPAAPLPRALARHGMARMGSLVFVVGGEGPLDDGGTAVSGAIYVGRIAANGRDVAWSAPTVTLPTALTDPAVAVIPP